MDTSSKGDEVLGDDEELGNNWEERIRECVK